MQKIHPHVALHYWREDEQSKIFTPDFMGRNAVSTTNPFQLVDVELNSDNPLFNWKIEGVSLHRASFDRTDLFWVNPEADVIAPTAYRESGNNFSRGLEGNPHNDGHGWVGGWMADCQTSPRDPVFWLFHCDIDRLWAKWQWTHNRFGTDGNDEKDYFPNDAYAAGSSVPFGHHLEDTMWPWDKKTGEQNAADPNDNRPDSGKEALFAKSGIPGVWPEEDASPQVKTMIDYFGAGCGNINLGFCYDDVPFGKKTENTPPLAGGSINAFADPTASWNARIRAGRNLRGSISVSERQKLKKILKTRSESDPIRRLALLRLNRDRASTWIPPAIEVITKRNNGGASLRSSIVEQLGIAAMFTPEGRKQKKQIFQTLEKLIDRKESLAVRLAAISPLLRMRNPKALALIKTSIRNPGKGVIPRSQAIRMLGLAQPGKNHDLFRPLLKKSVPNPVRIAALHVTGGDAESREVRRSIATAQSEPYRVRLVALQSLMHSDPDFPNLAIKIVKDVDENTSIRRVALAGIRIHAIANAKKLKKPGLEKVKQLLSTQRSGNRALSNSLKQAGLKLDQLIKRHQ